MKIAHHNRIKTIIENPDNEIKHFVVIDRMIENYEEMFGTCILSNNLRAIRNHQYNMIEDLTQKLNKLFINTIS